MTPSDDLESLLAPLRASFHAKRRDVAAECDAISELLESYLQAVDRGILWDLAKDHDLPAPALSTDTTKLALELLSRVENLPELRVLRPKPRSSAPPSNSEPADAKTKRDGLRVEGQKVAKVVPSSPNSKPPSLAPPSPKGNWPLVRATIAAHPLVIVGGPPHLERLANLAVDPDGQVEWVDTTRQGTHAIGNLERRIKDKRIGALLILEGLVQHRHSDPLVSTARGAHIPHAYGGKGGRSAIAQALDDLEIMFQQRQ